MIASTYSGKDVQVLDGVAAIRKRPTMYIGSVGKEGLFHIFKEVVDNAVDESIAGRCDRIRVQLDDETVTVADNGGGIPVEIHRQTKKSTLTTVFTHIHAGGKFGSDAYDSSIGVHGVGIKATNALSSICNVWTKRGRQWWHQSFKQGTAVQRAPAKSTKPEISLDSGTVVEFQADPSVFKHGIALDLQEVYDWLHIVAYINPQLSIMFESTEDGDYNEIIHYEDGLADYLDWMAEETKQEILDKYYETKGKGFECAIGFTDTAEMDPKWSLSWFTNTTANLNGGTHANAFWRAYNRAVSEFAKPRQYYENKDLRSHLVIALNIRLPEPQFSSQTKERLVDDRAKRIEENLYESLCKFFKSHPKTIKRVLEQAVEAYNARRSGMVSKELSQKIKEASKTMLPTKLTSAPYCKPEERECFIIEGESGAGTANMARVSSYNQETLALKGKILNLARSTTMRALTSSEVFSILVTLGYDPKNPASHKLRVRGKIVLLSDPDPDGHHINSLVLAALAVMVPQVFEEKLVYIVDAPEYMAEYKGGRYYGRTRDALYKNLPKMARNKIFVQHIKGWGEVDAPTLRDIAFDPNTRRLMQLKRPKPEQINRFLGLMSHDIEGRREILGIDVKLD